MPADKLDPSDYASIAVRALVKVGYEHVTVRAEAGGLIYRMCKLGLDAPQRGTVLYIGSCAIGALARYTEYGGKSSGLVGFLANSSTPVPDGWLQTPVANPGNASQTPASRDAEEQVRSREADPEESRTAITGMMRELNHDLDAYGRANPSMYIDMALVKLEAAMEWFFLESH